MKTFSEAFKTHFVIRLLYLLPVTCGIITYKLYQSQLSLEAQVFAILTVGTAGFTLLINLHRRRSLSEKGSAEEHGNGE